jgi:hypothetical protein
LANNIRRLAHRYGHNDFCDNRFGSCWSHLASGVPESLQFMVPLSAGDVGFISNLDEAHVTRARYGIEGYFYRSLASLGVTRRGDGQGLVLAHLRRLGSSSLDDESRRHRAWLPGSRLPPRFDTTIRPDLIASHEFYALRGRSKRLVVKSLVAQWYRLRFTE